MPYAIGSCFELCLYFDRPLTKTSVEKLFAKLVDEHGAVTLKAKFSSTESIMNNQTFYIDSWEDEEDPFCLSFIFWTSDISDNICYPMHQAANSRWMFHLMTLFSVFCKAAQESICGIKIGALGEETFAFTDVDSLMSEPLGEGTVLPESHPSYDMLTTSFMPHSDCFKWVPFDWFVWPHEHYPKA